MQVVSPWENAKRPVPPGPTMDLSQNEVTQTEFSGQRWRLFWLAFRTGLLTVLTLGFYRFWMKTRLRRWYWSAWRPAGHPLEYVGDPMEKLLGFLIAVVFLAFYIGIVNLVLMFASFSLFRGNAAAYLMSFVGVVPFWFYARYRARRYVLARTRWRGVRFGLEPGAWGYARRALWHWILTIVTLGLLWPRKAFYLEKYITDRTFFGTQRLTQGGRWFALFWPWFWVWLPAVLVCAAFGVLIYETTLLAEEIAADLFQAKRLSSLEVSMFWEMMFDIAVAFLMIAPFLLVLALVNYQVKRVRYFTSNKAAGRAQLGMKPRFWKVTGIYLGGYFGATVTCTLLVIPMGVIGVILLNGLGTDPIDLIARLSDLPRPVLVTSNIMLYFLIFLMWSTIVQAFVRFPLMRHFASTLTIHQLDQLAMTHQRPRDAFVEAEGFAEALDVGAAI